MFSGLCVPQTCCDSVCGDKRFLAVSLSASLFHIIAVRIAQPDQIAATAGQKERTRRFFRISVRRFLFPMQGSDNPFPYQIKEHSFTREYEAVVWGSVREDEGTVNAPIGRNPNDRKKMCITQKNSKEAVTHYSVIARYKGYTHIRCVLETGRTHQIRVHMASLGHPVAGDLVYGVKNEKVAFEGQCLHAKKIGFVHPATGEYMEFESELPEYFNNFLTKLRNISA